MVQSGLAVTTNPKENLVKSVEFSQTVCKGYLRIVDTDASVDLSVKAGIALDETGSLRSRDLAPNSAIVQALWERNIFSCSSDIERMGMELLALGKRVRNRNLALTSFIMQQSEYVRITTAERQVDDTRIWSMGRSVLTSPNGQTFYRDVWIDSSEDVLAEFASNTDAMLAELGDVNITTSPSLTIPGTVIFPPGTGGYFIHEVFGHMLEGDLVSQGVSVFGKHIHLGDRIGPDFLNVADDPAGFSEHIGLAAVDDEGEPLNRIPLVSAGTLSGYICDRETAALLGDGVGAGCARRQSYKHKAVPRMRSTFVSPTGTGNDLNQIIADTESGFLVSQLIAGNVNPMTGDFMLICGNGYVIVDGQITTPVRGVTLYGNALTAMRTIDTIGSDFKMIPLQCAKAGQILPVCAGSPTIRVHDLIATRNI